MYTTQTTISTQNARSYMRQLCKHWSHRFAVNLSEQQGDIAFSETQHVYLEATHENLLIRLQDQSTADTLAQLAQIVADHIQKFAFREPLQISWANPESL